jgi:hypothetical protein
MPDAKSLSYNRYLKLDELLSLQVARSAESGEPNEGEHDELLFITIHKDSLCPFCQGLPGSMNRALIRRLSIP